MTGCVFNTESAGPPVTETKAIELGKAELVNVEVALGVGELGLSAGTEKLFEGEFRHPENLSKPEVRYDDSGFRGRLTIASEKEEKGVNIGLSGKKNIENRWNLRFNEGVPLDFVVKLGVGESKLDFSRLKPRAIDVKVGVGTTDIDLRGNYQRDFDVTVHGGVGQATVRLPKDVAVTIDAKGGIGGVHTEGLHKDGSRWLNDAVGKAKTSIRLEVRGGVGEIRIIG